MSNSSAQNGYVSPFTVVHKLAVALVVFIVAVVILLATRAADEWQLKVATDKVGIEQSSIGNDRRVLSFSGLTKEQCSVIVRTFAPGSLFGLADSGTVDGRRVVVDAIDPTKAAGKACVKDGAAVEMVVGPSPKLDPPAPVADNGMAIESAGAGVFNVNLYGRSIAECRSAVAKVLSVESPETLVGLHVANLPARLDFHDPLKLANQVCQHDGDAMVFSMKFRTKAEAIAGKDVRAPEDQMDGAASETR